MPHSPITHSFLKNMVMLNSNRTGRVSSWDRTGGNYDYLGLAPGETAVLAEIDGPGLINHFYVTMQDTDYFHYRRAILRMYWDGEETPSVEVPIGDFFGIPFSQPVFFNSLLLSVNPGGDEVITDGLNAYFPMPFAKHARIELFNDAEVDLHKFWYHINYDRVPALEPDMGYFHACWRREAPCEKSVPTTFVDRPNGKRQPTNLTGDENYVILDAKGRGNYAGCILQVFNTSGHWYGEGDDMIFIDGESFPPTIHGTGTEEIFGGGACPNVPYTTPYCGFMQTENRDWGGCNAMYKFFINDPVRFAESIRVTLEHGHANDLANDYASVAYWYQDEPHAKLPALPSSDQRVPQLAEIPAQAADLWSQAMRLFREGCDRKTVPRDQLLSLWQLSWESRRTIRSLDLENMVSITERFLEESRRYCS